MIDIIAFKGNITTYPSDVIVNAARPSLTGGGGVDGAIHQAAGSDLARECKKFGGATTGEARITDSFDITSAEKIVHAVGPVYWKYTPEEAAKYLAACYLNSLDLSEGYNSVAFSGISTGSYGYPLEDATKVAVRAIRGWSRLHPESSIELVTLIAFTQKELDVFEQYVDY